MIGEMDNAPIACVKLEQKLPLEILHHGTGEKYGETVLKESQIASMQEFLNNIRLLINTLGYKVLVPTPQANEKTQYLYCKGSNAEAKGFLSTDGLTVLKVSRISDHTVSSFEAHGASYFQLRKHIIDDGTIANNVFQNDYEFSSPSAASSVILGRTSNGNIDWKSETGTQLKDL